MNPNGSDRQRVGARLSPSALAELNRRLALQSYLPKSGGLFGSGWAQFLAERAGSAGPLVGANPVQAAQLRQAPAALRAIRAGQVPIAAPAPSRWPIPVPGCASCHGPRQPPTPPPSLPRPPADDPWTYYPDISRRSGSGWGTSPERSGDDRKQCEIQQRRDTEICGRQPQDVRRPCRASAMERYQLCLRTGRVDDPALDTAKRLDGEPPIRRWRPKPKPRLR